MAPRRVVLAGDIYKSAVSGAALALVFLVVASAVHRVLFGDEVGAVIVTGLLYFVVLLTFYVIMGFLGDRINNSWVVLLLGVVVAAPLVALCWLIAKQTNVEWFAAFAVAWCILVIG